MTERSCEVCSKVFVGRLSKPSRFCSRVCYDSVYRSERGPCEFCGIKPINRKSTKFCSIECHHAQQRAAWVRQCKHCGNTFTRRYPGLYCNHTCAANARSKAPGIDRPCVVCGAQIQRKSLKYCSRKCAASQRLTTRQPCKQCGKMLPRRGLTFCGTECAVAFRKPAARICTVCGVNEARVDRKTCSKACSLAATRTKTKYTAEQIAAFEADRKRGDTIDAMAIRYGLTAGQILGVLSRKRLVRIKPKPESKPRVRVRKRVVQYRRSQRTSAPPATGPKPEAIEPRELWRHAGVLRMHYDIHINRNLELAELTLAVSRAYKRVEPGHAGFRLKQQGNWVTDHRLKAERQ